MTAIRYGEAHYECAPGQTVLDCLTAGGVVVPSSCRAGVCQSCLMRALEGPVPAEAQVGLKPTLAAQGYFLACNCRPRTPLTVALPDAAQIRLAARVVSIEPLNDEIVAVRLEPSRRLAYRAGQFIRLFRDDSQSRCYSLASVPDLDEVLEIHVRAVPGGQVSGWVHRELREGDAVQIADSSGQCFYTDERREQPLLLMGTGSGLAPLYGILRDALHRGHRGPVWLYHGSTGAQGLYRTGELRALAERHAQFRYVPCVSEGEASPGLRAGTPLDAALADHPDLGGWRVFLCGHPELVRRGRTETFLAGASMADIHADPFLPSGALATAA